MWTLILSQVVGCTYIKDNIRLLIASRHRYGACRRHAACGELKILRANAAIDGHMVPHERRTLVESGCMATGETVPHTPPLQLEVGGVAQLKFFLINPKIFSGVTLDLPKWNLPLQSIWLTRSRIPYEADQHTPQGTPLALCNSEVKLNVDWYTLSNPCCHFKRYLR